MELYVLLNVQAVDNPYIILAFPQKRERKNVKLHNI